MSYPLIKDYENDSKGDIISPINANNIEEWIDKNGCDLNEYMNNIKVLEDKGSSSDSVILFGDLSIKHKKTSVAFKIVFQPYSKFDNSLQVEQQIYTNVTENLINNFHTPHLTSCIGLVKLCDTDSLFDKLSKQQQENFEKATKNIDWNVYNENKASILILSKSSGKTLHYYMDSDMLFTDDKFNIIFQILYTLKCFSQIGLTHNDLHLNNIFVDELDTPDERIYYISEDKWVKMKIKYDVKIFDFDRGAIYHPAVERNFPLDMDFCINVDQCNIFNSRKDLSSVIGSLLRLEKDVVIRNYLKSVVTQKFLNSVYERKYIHLNTFPTENTKHLTDVRKMEYLAGPEITYLDIKSISECISNLIDILQFSKTTGSGKSTGKIYTLPFPIKTTYWNPTSNISHKSWNIPLNQKSISEFITDEYVDSIKVKYIIPNNMHEKEFGINFITNCRKKMFVEYIKRKNIDPVYHETFMVGFYILSLPFVYKFDSRELKTFILNTKELNIPQEIILLIVNIIDDIWNVFNGTLPVEVEKM